MNKKFEDIISEQGKLVYTAEGNSMFPLIKPRDLLVIEAVRGRLSVGDVPLYKRDSGQYVLHRVVEVRRGGYVMKGDNRAFREKGITDRHIIGVLTAIVRDGRTFPAETAKEYAERNAGDLVYLLSCAVSGETPDSGRVEKLDLAEIFRLSQLHMLTSAVSFALERSIPLPHDFDQAKKKAIRKLTLFEVEREAICSELEKAGIWYMPLKGIVLKDSYPKAAMRQMTDNDFLVDPSRMEDVRAIMESLGYSCDVFGHKNHDVYSKPPTMEFEMHNALFHEDEMPQFREYYSDLESKMLSDGFCRRLRDEEFYIYFISHTFKHYSHGGSGLRSLLDVFVYLRAHPSLDREYADAQLKKLGIVDFEEKLRRLSGKLFSGEALSRDEKKELEYFVSSGSSGTSENRQNNDMFRKLGNDDSGAAKLRYLKSRVFLSGKKLETNYPFVAKHRALYPLLFVYRPIKGAFRRPKELLTEYKRLKSFRKKG